MKANPYQILGVSSSASPSEIKSAYRELVKQHHPDAGGDQQTILAINAAWEVLRDPEKRKAYDHIIQQGSSILHEAKTRSARNARASAAAKVAKGQALAAEDELVRWLKEVYIPIDNLLGQIINPFQSKLRDLSADPYDDFLMKAFCSYLEESQAKLEQIERLYKSLLTPNIAQGFGLSLYHCLSQVKDAFDELERYTIGYVDNYLHDGREMLREAQQIRLRLQEERRKLSLL